MCKDLWQAATASFRVSMSTTNVYCFDILTSCFYQEFRKHYKRDTSLIPGSLIPSSGR